MDILDMIKIARNDYYEVSVNKIKNYMHISFLGVWDKRIEQDLAYYLEDIEAAVKSLSKDFNAIIDLMYYRGSTSEYTSLHINAQKLALKAGLNKTAVLISGNDMLKITIEYIFSQSGIKATYFSKKFEAERWLEL